MIMVAILLSIVVVLFLIGIIFLLRDRKKLIIKISKLDSAKRSESVKRGLIAEQLIPFSSKFKYDTTRFTFIGKPVDGILFLDDKIIIMEFKTGSSRLSKRQRQIKTLVNDGKVEFEIIRVK